MTNDPVSDSTEKKHQLEYTNPSDTNSITSVEFNNVFKQLFYVAAQRLAYQIREPIDQLGQVFEEPLETGSLKARWSLSRQLSIQKLTTYASRKHSMHSNASKVLGRGRYLFLVRQLDKSKAANFAALGCRFGSVANVAELLARSMQVNHAKLTTHLERMRISSSTEHLHPSGVHLACFMVRPSITTRFDVLVPILKQNQLPLSTLPITKITKSHHQILQNFDELTVRDILKDLIDETVLATDRERDFRWQLHNAFVRLVDLTADSETMMQARFSATPVQAPCRSDTVPNSPTTCSLLSIRLLGTIHSTCRSTELTYVPLDFFATQQRVRARGADSIGAELVDSDRTPEGDTRDRDEAGHPNSQDKGRPVSTDLSLHGESGREVDTGKVDTTTFNDAERTFVHDLFMLFGLSKA